MSISGKVKIIVGRNHSENELLKKYRDDRILARTADFPGAVILVEGDPTQEEMEIIAAVTARYSAGRNASTVKVMIQQGESVTEIYAEPMNISIIDITGRELFSERVNIKAGFYQGSININHLSKGFYYLRFSNSQEFRAFNILLK